MVVQLPEPAFSSNRSIYYGDEDMLSVLAARTSSERLSLANVYGVYDKFESLDR